MNKKMISLLIVLLVIIFSILAFISLSSPSQDESYLCKELGGEWKQFANSCADLCIYRNQEMRFCTRETVEGCDCGNESCWNGSSCVKNGGFI